MAEIDKQRLGTWLRPHTRFWLSVEGTQEHAPESTTEQWLNAWAYPGRKEWIGDQRIVEYVNPQHATPLKATQGPFLFGSLVGLDSYSLAQTEEPASILLDLHWLGQAPIPLNVSIQLLSTDGAVLHQLDRPLAEFQQGGAFMNRMAMSSIEHYAALVLKIYEADTGEVLAPDPQSPAENHEYFVLYRDPG
jgi:hypothetical protein